MTRWLVGGVGVSALAWVSACASGGAGGARPSVSDMPVERRAILTSDAGVMYSDAPVDEARVIAAPPAAVLEAVRATYTGFMIPITLDDPATRRVGNPDFQRTRQFVGRPMVELVNCGGGITGPNAISFRIFMNLVTRVQDAPNGQSKVTVQFSASGKDVASGASADKIPCGSTGRIESRFFEEIGKRVAGR
jgi:hypothetical protein